MMPYFIGEYYQYRPDGQKFKLKSFNGFKFTFECGHWCTDSVFADLLRVKTGIYNWQQEYQLSINF